MEKTAYFSFGNKKICFNFINPALGPESLSWGQDGIIPDEMPEFIQKGTMFMNTAGRTAISPFPVEGAAHDELALFTDLYELTMLQAYYHEKMEEEAVFSLFSRRLPEQRKFLLACGLDTVLTAVENLHFNEDSLSYLEATEKFSREFLAWLRGFRFTGDIRAVPEGTPVFADEPILEVIAPLPQAQLLETFVMNQVHLQTVLASKAWRVVSAARGRTVVDFGSRRMHGIDAALKAARAFYIAGVDSTSNVLAGKRYDIPVSGTMAHSYIQAHEDELSAFQAFADLYPRTVLLVDTYDTIAGIHNVTALADTLGDAFQISAVRLDSGDLLALSRKARQLLDSADLNKVEIFASGGLEEHSIAQLLSSGAPINGFGVGTGMGVSSDAPALDMAYKLCEYAGKGRLKLSTGKPVLPGQKQIFRREENGRDIGDTIGRAKEDLPGRPLLETVMHKGRRLDTATKDLKEIRSHARKQTDRLPSSARQIVKEGPFYPVKVSEALSDFQQEVTKRVSS